MIELQRKFSRPELGRESELVALSAARALIEKELLWQSKAATQAVRPRRSSRRS
jgi:hypothetical protein